MVPLGWERRLLYSAVKEAAAGAGQLQEQPEVKAALGEEVALVVVQVSALEVDAVPVTGAQSSSLEVQEQELELLVLAAAEPLCLGAYGEAWGYDQVQEKVSSDAELTEGEGDSECGRLESLEA